MARIKSVRMRNNLRVGMILNYEGGQWVLESIEPSGSFWRWLWSAITRGDDGTSVVFYNRKNPSKKISFPKNHKALDNLEVKYDYLGGKITRKDIQPKK
jgi:hypothetical protein